MVSLQQVKWSRLRNLNDDVLSTFQTDTSFATICCKSIQCFKSRTGTWDNLPTDVYFEKPLAYSNGIVRRAFDDKNKRMYILEHNNEFKILDFTLKKCTTFNSQSLNNDNTAIIMVNNKIHAIGWTGHHIWNDNAARFDIKTKSQLLSTVDDCRLHYLPSRKIILLIHGGYTGKILSYCTITNIWSKIKMFVPEVSNVSTVVTRDDNYVFMLGVCDNSNNMKNDMYVLDMKRKEVLRCNVKCPASGPVEIAMLNDFNMEELTTFGFVRNSWKNKQYENMLFPPMYLIKLVRSYYWKDEIHLFRNALHWKISVDVVLNNSTPCEPMLIK